MKIIPFEIQYTQDLKKLGQSLRQYIVSLETRENDLVIYNTNTEIGEYITDFENKKNTILLAQENNNIIAYGIGNMKDSDWEGSQIKRFGQIKQLFVNPDFRGKGIAQEILYSFEKVFLESGASHIEISVFAHNTRAHNFYKKYGFEERLITLDKEIQL